MQDTGKRITREGLQQPVIITGDSRVPVFRQMILGWWARNTRDYPWRRNRTVYRTLVAEMMLRRTRADQVVPVFCNFLERYPTLSAAASEDASALRTMLWPLGLMWRIENIITMVGEAHRRFGDDLPADCNALKTLSGVGDYVAAAVACFAGGAVLPIIDTNVVRLLGRYFGVDTRGEARRRSDMLDLAHEALDPNSAADYNYAVLDFGACVCIARRPYCAECPLMAGCMTAVVGAPVIQETR